MRITRIRVKYHIKIPADKRPEADRALATHPTRCPAYMSVKDSIEVEFSHEIEEE